MIQPVSLANAAASDYADGDVRHFSDGDAIDVPSISNPTRQLAYRDNLLAEKVNELVSNANNSERVVGIPIPRIVVPAGTEQVVANYRIQDGFESRVINAIVTTYPSSPNVQLNIYWSDGFGNSTGNSIVTTSAEYTAGSAFSPTGEFIVSIKNTGSATFDAIASVSLSTRPTSDLPVSLVPGPLVIREQVPGATGAAGQTGGVGPGTTGPAGLNPRGQWAILNTQGGTNTYNINDMVWSNYGGVSGISSYRCILAHTPTTGNQPNPASTPSTYWDWIASAGAIGAAGSSGVSFTTNTYQSSGTTASDFLNGSSDGEDDYGAYGLLAANTVYGTAFSFNEIVGQTSANNGFSLMTMHRQLFFKGSLYIAIPQNTWAQWSTGMLNCAVIPNGQVASDEYFSNYSGTMSNGNPLPTMAETGTNHAILPVVTPDAGGWTIDIGSAYPQKVNLSITGYTTIAT